MARLPESFLDDLRANNDITAVMESYVNIKRAGRDYVCSCPFHSEKTPSCHIYTETQSFYCFGCGAGGDVITFIRLIERLEYIESVRFLAQRAGMSMPDDQIYDDGTNLRVRILEMNKAAARYFRDVLISPQGAPGMEYLLSRGLTQNTIRKYGLGFAPDGWHNLHFHLRSLGFSEDEMKMGALITQNNNNYYDKFRNRVMFPIIDRRKNVIGFGGRALEKDAKAKYLNSDETPVFHKRDNLFSINFAKNTEEKCFILCEGYMDVISLNQAGFDNAVATLGTAITPQQANLMKRYTQNVVISYDSDAAGQKATVKAINLLSEAGVQSRVLHIPDAKDPDEYIKNYGADSFRRILERTETALDYEFGKLKRGLELDTPAGKTEFLKRAVNFLADIRNDTERTVYISETAALSGQQISIITELVKEKRKKNAYFDKKEQEKQIIRGTAKRDPINPDALKYPVQEKAERGIIAFLFHSPDRLADVENKINPEDFPTEFNRRVYIAVRECLKSGQTLDFSSIGEEFTADEVGRITGICRQGDMLPYSLPRLDEYIKVLIKFREERSRTPVSEMTNEEMLAMVEEFKKRKKPTDS